MNTLAAGIKLQSQSGKTVELYQGDSLNILKGMEDNSIDLIVTSPPYSDQRKSTYGGVHPDRYVEWFLPISAELLRVLKPTGSFILNIKEKVYNGERHTYVLELILAMRKQGWLWTEEYMWHKRNSFPGKWPNRLRDAWERLLHFNKDKKFNMYQDEVKVPIGDWSKTRLKNLSDTDKTRDESKVGSGFGKKIENWVKDILSPTNINSEEKIFEQNNNVTVNFSIKPNSNENSINFSFNVIFDSKNEKILSSNNDKVLVEKDHKIASIEFSIESNSGNSLQTNYQIGNTPSEIVIVGNDALIQDINIGNDIN